MSSAHHFTEANIWPKLKENPSRGKGATERTRNSRLKPMTLNYDHDLNSAWLSYDPAHRLTNIISLRQTFERHLKKILPGIKEIWSRHQIQGSNSWLSTVTLTLSPQGWVMGSAHCPTEVNIRPKFGEDPPRGKGDTERTQNSRLKPVILNCDLVSLHDWAMCSAHHLTEANIWAKLKEYPSRGKGDIEWTRNNRAQTHDLGMWPCPWVPMAELWVLHIFPLVDIWPKFRQNPIRGKGDTERTRNSRLKHMAFNCDLDLKSAWLSYWFYTSSH